FNWAGGTMSGSGDTDALSGMTISGTSKVLDRRSLHIPLGVAAIWTSGAGDLVLQNGAVLVNDGLLDMQIGRSVTASGIAPVFQNFGIVRLSHTAETATLAVPFSNFGT